MAQRRENPAARLSKQLLAKGLLQLMKSWPYADITVLQICQQAGVARKTWYRHFTSKNDVLSFALDELMDGFYEEFGPQNVTLYKEVGNCFAYMLRHRDMLSLLHRQGLFYMMADKLRGYIQNTYCVEEMIQVMDNHDVEEYLVYYVANTVAGVAQQWVAEGFQLPHSTVTLLCTNLLTGNFRQPEVAVF